MFKGLNCDRKSQLSEILTEPLNPRVLVMYLCRNNALMLLEYENHENPDELKSVRFTTVETCQSPPKKIGSGHTSNNYKNFKIPINET